MDYKKKAVFNWSGGKDSALALHKVLKEKDFSKIDRFISAISIGFKNGKITYP